MSDFIREVDEEYRQDQFRHFLARYWVLLLLLVVLVLAAAGGWRGYQYYHQQQAEAAGARYFDAVDGGTDPKATVAALDALGREIPTGYGLLARLRAAGDLSRIDGPGAVKAFDAIASDAAVAQEFRDVAALRAGILLVDTAPPAELRRRLEPLADANSPYRSIAREMLAVAALKRGDDTEAGRWLDAIEADRQAPPDSRQRAGFFLGLVRAGKPAAAAPAAAAAAPAAVPTPTTAKP